MVVTIKLDLRLIFVGLTAFCVVAAALWIAFPSAHKWFPDKSSDLASWIQAIGSIAAIAAGFLMARFQANLARVQQRVEKEDIRREAIIKQSLLLIEACDEASNVANSIRRLAEVRRVPWGQASILFNDLIRHFQSLDIPLFVNSLDVAKALEILRKAELLRSWFDASVKNNSDSDNCYQLENKLEQFIAAYERNKLQLNESINNMAKPEDSELIRNFMNFLEKKDAEFAQASRPSGIKAPDLPSPHVGHA